MKTAPGTNFLGNLVYVFYEIQYLTRTRIAWSESCLLGDYEFAARRGVRRARRGGIVLELQLLLLLKVLSNKFVTTSTID